MYLHEDEDEFINVILEVSEASGYRADVLEKDYYVTLFLKELSKMQNENGLRAFFKGGTALYKGMKRPKRFSEDIDLTLDISGLNNSQIKRTLKMASQGYVSLPRLKAHKKEKNFRSEALMVYGYSPRVNYEANDRLERFGEIQIEATTFTISEPTEALEVESLIYDNAPENIKNTLEEFHMCRFEVMAISLERMFIDKLFAAEAYVKRSHHEDRTMEASKHIYDLIVLADHGRIKRLFQDEELMEQLLQIQMKEEIGRIHGASGIAPRNFKFFEEIIGNKKMEKGFQTMQDIYVFKDEDKISFHEAVEKISCLKNDLNGNKAWRKAKPPGNNGPSDGHGHR